MFARRFAAAFCLFFCLVLLAVPAGCGGCAHRMAVVHDDVSHFMVCVECGESSAPQAHTLLRVQLTSFIGNGHTVAVQTEQRRAGLFFLSLVGRSGFRTEQVKRRSVVIGNLHCCVL